MKLLYLANLNTSIKTRINVFWNFFIPPSIHTVLNPARGLCDCFSSKFFFLFSCQITIFPFFNVLILKNCKLYMYCVLKVTKKISKYLVKLWIINCTIHLLRLPPYSRSKSNNSSLQNSSQQLLYSFFHLQQWKSDFSFNSIT